MANLLEITENLQKGKAKIVKELVAKAIEEGLPAVQILNEGLLSGMNVIGEKFKNGEVYVPVKGALNLFGFTTKVENNAYVGTLGENTVEIALDGKSLKFNGTSVDGIKIDKGTVYVSANKLAASLGESANWDEASKTLIITKEVAAQ